MKKLKLIWASLIVLGTQFSMAYADDPIGLSIVKEKDGSHSVQAWFMVDSSTAAAWETLSDYDALTHFVPNVRSSTKSRGVDEQVYVDQVMVGRAGPLRKNISLRLQIREEPSHRICFRDVLGHSFRHYSGTWEIAGWDNGVAVTYKLNALPNFYAPDFVIDGIFKRDVLDLLERVRTEIIRRSQHV
jgi:hypothetical protein